MRPDLVAVEMPVNHIDYEELIRGIDCSSNMITWTFLFGGMPQNEVWVQEPPKTPFILFQGVISVLYCVSCS